MGLGVEPARIPALVHHVDVVPTLLELIGLPELPDAAGLSLVPLLRDGEPLPERTLFADIGGEVSAYRGSHFARRRYAGLLRKAPVYSTAAAMAMAQRRPALCS